jgi:hypothetical protein
MAIAGMAFLSWASGVHASLPSEPIVETCDRNHFILDWPCVYSDPASWAWSPAGEMTVARSQHTATLLEDGRVLVAGGTSRVDVLRSAELYEPITRTWTRTGDMTAGRRAHAAVRLRDGRVLVMSDGTAEMYHPDSGTWSAIDPPLTPRLDHTMTALPDGQVLIVGGGNPETYLTDDNALSSAEIFDPATGRWRATAPMATGRYWHGAALLADGTVMVVGGATLIEYHGYTAQSEIFDPRTETWRPAGRIGIARSLFGAVPAFDGTFVVAGGYSSCGFRLCTYARTDRYVPGTGWVAAAAMLAPRNSHTLTPLVGGHLIAVGGEDWSSQYPPPPLASTELYSPATNTWANAAPLASPRAWHTATLLLNGTLLVTGGHTSEPLRTAEVFAPSRTPRPHTNTRK